MTASRSVVAELPQLKKTFKSNRAPAAMISKI